MPPGTKSVARPTRYGNPFVVKYAVTSWWAEGPDHRGHPRATKTEAAADAVGLFTLHAGRVADDADLDALTGFNLACWCPLDQPCHADVLLEWANP